MFCFGYEITRYVQYEKPKMMAKCNRRSNCYCTNFLTKKREKKLLVQFKSLPVENINHKPKKKIIVEKPTCYRVCLFETYWYILFPSIPNSLCYLTPLNLNTRLFFFIMQLIPSCPIIIISFTLCKALRFYSQPNVIQTKLLDPLSLKT